VVDIDANLDAAEFRRVKPNLETILSPRAPSRRSQLPIPQAGSLLAAMLPTVR
jgi:hypothetical protein